MPTKKKVQRWKLKQHLRQWGNYLQRGLQPLYVYLAQSQNSNSIL